MFIKISILCLLASVCLSIPQGQHYSNSNRNLHRSSIGHSRGGFSSLSSGHFPNSHERFSGLDSDERFHGGSHFGVNNGIGFRQGHSSGIGSLSHERFGGDSSEYSGHSGLKSGLSRGIGHVNHGGFRSGYGRSDGLGNIAILRDDREDSGDGAYSFVFESEDGVQRQESGSPTGNNGAVVQQGSWSFTYPDGTPAKFNFIADENGYQVQSDLIPAMPLHALQQIEKAEQERAAGIFHDGQYRAEDHFGDDGSYQNGRSSFHGSSGAFNQRHLSLGGGGVRSFPAHSSFGDSSEAYRDNSLDDSSEAFRRGQFGSFHNGQHFGSGLRSGSRNFGSRRFLSSHNSYEN